MTIRTSKKITNPNFKPKNTKKQLYWYHENFGEKHANRVNSTILTQKVTNPRTKIR